MQKEILPKFFKLLAPGPGFPTQLSLPPFISKKLIMVVKEEEERGAKLVSRKGMFHVYIHKSKNGGFSFACGWKEFVDEHNLQLGDLLVFEHTGNLIFKVTLFHRTCCEKGLLFHVEHDTNCDPNGNSMGEEENAAQRQNLKAKETRLKNQKKQGNKGRLRKSIRDTRKKQQFSAAMNHSNILRNSPYLYVPSAFCKANGLLPKKGRVTLKGPSGEEHQGCLTVYDRYNEGCIHTEVWRGFAASNNLKVGDTCVFKLGDSSDANGIIVFDVEVHAAAASP